jgi:hypothetical protein
LYWWLKHFLINLAHSHNLLYYSQLSFQLFSTRTVFIYTRSLLVLATNSPLVFFFDSSSNTNQHVPFPSALLLLSLKRPQCHHPVLRRKHLYLLNSQRLVHCPFVLCLHMGCLRLLVLVMSKPLEIVDLSPTLNKSCPSPKFLIPCNMNELLYIKSKRLHFLSTVYSTASCFQAPSVHVCCLLLFKYICEYKFLCKVIT